MSADAAAAAAVFEWQDGARRLAATTGPTRVWCLAVVDAVHAELHRRLGRSFTVADLAAAHRDAGAWFLPLATAVAPRPVEAHDLPVQVPGRQTVPREGGEPRGGGGVSALGGRERAVRSGQLPQPGSPLPPWGTLRRAPAGVHG